MFFYLIPLAVVLVDQLTKEAIIRAFRLGEGFPIIPGYLDITFVLNPGASFSLLATLPESIRVPFFIVVSAAAVILIVVYRTCYLRADRFGSICLALILGGAIGNLIDRIRYGVVVDFIDAHLHQYHWPVFNVADSAISVGVTLLILQMVLEWRKERKSGR
jgi:signal peptidase II